MYEMVHAVELGRPVLEGKSVGESILEADLHWQTWKFGPRP